MSNEIHKINEPKHSLQYRVDTTINGSEIVQELHSQEQMLSSWVMNTRDAHIRNALIKMGWTPPKE